MAQSPDSETQMGQRTATLNSDERTADLGDASLEPLERDRTYHEHMDKKERFEKIRLFVLVNAVRILPAGFAIGCFLYIIVLVTNEDNWSVDDSDTDQVKLDRVKARGTFVSIMIAILMNIIGSFMFYIKVKEGLVVTNYGFILGPIVGFMLDQGIGTDEGWENVFTGAGFRYTFASLVGGNFMRYIITVFLDMFISNPLQDIFKQQLKELGVLEMLRVDDPEKPKMKYLRLWDLFVALNFPSILQSVVAFVTFNAYTNQTRFAWAYADETLDREIRIPPGTIMLSTAIAGVLYLVFYTLMDKFSDREYFDVNTKLMYVVLILLLLYGLNSSSSIEAPVEGEEVVRWTEDIEAWKPVLGFLLFVGVVLYGFVYPVWTRLGCVAGYCKPTKRELADTDAFVDDEGKPGEGLSAELTASIQSLIRQEMKLRQNGVQFEQGVIRELGNSNPRK